MSPHRSPHPTRLLLSFVMVALWTTPLGLPTRADAAPATRPAPSARPAPTAKTPPPRLLITLAPAKEANGELRHQASPAEGAWLAEAWLHAVQAEPLTLNELGLKDPTPAELRRELARRRLVHWQVTLHIESFEHAYHKSEPPELSGTVTVTVTFNRLLRPTKAPLSVTAQGRVSVPASVATQGEILAVRQAALRAAATSALEESLPKLLKAR